MTDQDFPARPMATVLSIAGSDPSGGAGIQADLKTFTAIGVYGGAVLTSLTVQNTLGVRHMVPLAPDLVAAQIREVLADLTVSHIKIGMVSSAAIAVAIGEALQDFNGQVIYDPVMRATSGKSLLEEGALPALENHLLGRVTVLTPNLPELTQLNRRQQNHADDPGKEAAADLFARFPRLQAVIVTGGHAEHPATTVTDHLWLRPLPGTAASVITSSHPRIQTRNSHGTGCTFASAFTAYHQQTNDYRQAFALTVSFVDHLLRQSKTHTIGHGNGPLLHHLWQRQR